MNHVNVFIQKNFLHNLIRKVKKKYYLKKYTVMYNKSIQNEPYSGYTLD